MTPIIDLSSNQNQKPIEKSLYFWLPEHFWKAVSALKQLIYNFLTGNNYPYSPHSQGVWNLPHKFHRFPGSCYSRPKCCSLTIIFAHLWPRFNFCKKCSNRSQFFVQNRKKEREKKQKSELSVFGCCRKCRVLCHSSLKMKIYKKWYIAMILSPFQLKGYLMSIQCLLYILGIWHNTHLLI